MNLRNSKTKIDKENEKYRVQKSKFPWQAMLRITNEDEERSRILFEKYETPQTTEADFLRTIFDLGLDEAEKHGIHLN